MNHDHCRRALGKISAERRKQEEQWGAARHADDRWLGLLMEAVGEVAKELNDPFPQGGYRHCLRAELVQVAAVCCAWLECLYAQDDEEGRAADE